LARRYVAGGLAVAVLVAGASAVALHQNLGKAGSGPRRVVQQAPSPTSAARIFYGESDHLSSARLDGTSLGPATTQLFNRGPDMNAPAWPSPDRHWLLLADGELVDLTADKPVPPIQAVPLELVAGSPTGVPEGAQAQLATSSPWADHSRRLVVAYGDQLSSVELATGATVALGTGQQPAGDPVSDGAAYVVPGTLPPLGDRDFFASAFAVVTRIERVSAGGRPQTLVTGPQLVSALHGSAAAVAVATSVVFSPDGGRLAVAIALIDGARRSGAVVVLDRRGGIVGVSPTPYAHGLTWLAWSARGDVLAFGIAFPRNGFSFDPSTGDPPFLEPQLWRPGSGRARSIFIPTLGNAPVLSACLWSPDGTALLCGDEQAWPFLSVPSGPVSVRDQAPGRPLAWVPAYAGSRHG
jgi:hypothetical protein